MYWPTEKRNASSILADLQNHLTWKLTPYDVVSFIAVNVGTFAAIWIILRCIWKPSKPRTSSDENKNLIEQDEKVSNKGLREIHEGEAAGDYSEDWTKTFDLVFVIVMGVVLVFNIFVTAFLSPSTFTTWQFWFKNIALFLAINITFFFAGLLCRHFCAIDEHGYIITNRHSAFKVNYTKKVHHFAIYLMPLLIVKLHLRGDENMPPSLHLLWHYWFEVLSTLLLIKPLRERFTFLMIQFNAMDRPEDRPYTLLWTVAYNNIPGFLSTIFFRWLYPKTGVHVDLMTIVSLVNTVGDGLAEPVGIYLGKHRYKTRGCFNKTAYERSFEGSSCVFMASMIFTTVFYYAFRSRFQYWLTMLTLPIIMALTEALSPHTIDSFFIHLIGGFVLLFTSHIPNIFV